jgi:DNA-binding transcriptional LysR family regulator
MKLSHVRDVLAVAELGSLRAAGRRVGIAQPAITRSIREIEHELGAALFERHSKGVRLTLVGEAFTRRALIVDSELRRAREEVEQIKGRSTGQVRVAMSLSSSIALLPMALACFRKRYPDALVSLSESSFEAVEHEVADGRIDFFVGGLDLQSVAPGLSVDRLFDNDGVVVARRGHKLLETNSLESIAAARWIRPSLSTQASEADFERFFEERGLPRPIVVMQTRSAVQTLVAVASSDLLSAVPRQWLDLPGLADSVGVLTQVGPVAAAPVCVVRQSGVPLTPIAEHLCDVVRRRAANYQRELSLSL